MMKILWERTHIYYTCTSRSIFCMQRHFHKCKQLDIFDLMFLYKNCKTTLVLWSLFGVYFMWVLFTSTTNINCMDIFSSSITTTVVQPKWVCDRHFPNKNCIINIKASNLDVKQNHGCVSYQRAEFQGVYPWILLIKIR